tara:strand:- start:1472 stop:1723 length:252 start_codon:yes stop_codon:yes gene_type:complete
MDDSFGSDCSEIQFRHDPYVLLGNLRTEITELKGNNKEDDLRKIDKQLVDLLDIIRSYLSKNGGGAAGGGGGGGAAPAPQLRV